jgi:DNA-directed RNA polymerase specialized sigma subunit
VHARVDPDTDLRSARPRPAVDLLVLEQENRVALREVSSFIRVALHQLTEREHLVLAAYYGLYDWPPLTFRQIGELLGNTHQRAQQLHAGALEKLRRGVALIFLRLAWAEGSLAPHDRVWEASYGG